MKLINFNYIYKEDPALVITIPLCYNTGDLIEISSHSAFVDFVVPKSSNKISSYKSNIAALKARIGRTIKGKL